MLAATVPPPGFHYRIYNTWYNPTTMKDNNGDKSDIDLDVFSMVHRFVHVTERKILGANYFYNLIVPLVDKDLTLGPYTDSQSLALGDTVFEFFGLAWHQPRWDAAFALAVIAPTGEYDSAKLASPGLVYWSGMLTLGGTIYLDAQRSWSLSALTRTLVHTKQDETEVTPGSEFVVEYGLGKEIPQRQILHPAGDCRLRLLADRG
ncbi:SphA family protein [Desulfosarcina cetonica]|uniref:SphA family protein n=1 Tax=Desulfosarcina cetonica TaxID=90730 RepID=UPI001BCE8BE9|nr:transporter [Desulfosarcina cetonica]